MYKFFIIGFVVAAVAAVPAPEAGAVEGVPNLDCLQLDDDLFSCLAIKANNALTRAARSSDFQLLEGIKFVRDPNVPVERNGKSLKPETEVLNELPRDITERTLNLANMLFESAMTFFKTHSLKVSMSDETVSRAINEGRGKIKKLVLPLVAGAALKLFALVPILFGGLALLVFKAVVVGKIALLLAAVLAFQRMFGAGAGIGGGLFGKTPQPVSGWYDGQNNQAWSGASAQGQGYYRRSFDGTTKGDAQNLAYSAHAPTNNETN
ncbi:uncharacterized protein LOC122505152 [Leptopilina heterotoma]|uniref:uncharacterized protein LOC122505152 n=1 Tax=Leptopilina heterotoma TaxID=63436 RepID=UPI001CA8B137|nr:uncharacterized protein LOC122505152 [Leptopilina heterotoma]